MTIHNPDPSEFSRMTSSVGSIRVIEYLITSATYGEIPPPIVNAVTACHSSFFPIAPVCLSLHRGEKAGFISRARYPQNVA